MKLLVVTLSMMLFACSNAPQVSYYQLPPAATNTAELNTAKRLYVEPVQVASYLNGRGLVLQVSAVELIMARQHLWAEALDQQLRRQLRQQMALSAPAYAVQLQPDSESVRLQLMLDSFHGNADGYAVLSGHFHLSHQSQPQAFNLRVALTDDGYPALVAALGRGVTQLSQLIAVQLEQ